MPADQAHGDQAAAKQPPAKRAAQARQRPRRPEHDPADRGLHDIVGGGASQLGVSGALRGRDVNRPTEQDLADAEREVQIVRRHWKPAD